MRRVITTMTTVGLVLAATLVGPPAHAAGKVSWTDKEGDAGSFLSAAASPLPSEPSLDAIKVEISSDGTALMFVGSVKKLSEGQPQGSPGAMYRFHFDHADITWALRVSEHVGTGAAFALRASDSTSITDLSCEKCTGVVDRKLNAVVVKAPMASLSKGMAEWDPEVPAMKAGDKLTSLLFITQRYYGRVTPTADEAPAPEDAALTL